MIYLRIRQSAFSEQNIRSGFQAIGLIPYNPQRFLSSSTVTKTPSPPGTSNGEQPNWTSETPHTLVLLEKQSQLVRDLVQRHSQSPTSQAVSALIKGCQVAMNSAAILAEENKKGRFLLQGEGNSQIRGVDNEVTIARRQTLPTCSNCVQMEQNLSIPYSLYLGQFHQVSCYILFVQWLLLLNLL
jgi:hypothetical protein